MATHPESVALEADVAETTAVAPEEQDVPEVPEPAGDETWLPHLPEPTALSPTVAPDSQLSSIQSTLSLLTRQFAALTTTQQTSQEDQSKLLQAQLHSSQKVILAMVMENSRELKEQLESHKAAVAVQLAESSSKAVPGSVDSAETSPVPQVSKTGVQGSGPQSSQPTVTV